MSATSSFAPSMVPGGFVAPSARVASLTRRPRFVPSRTVSRPAAAAAPAPSPAPAPAKLAEKSKPTVRPPPPSSRRIERRPTRSGEKPFEQLVAEAFDGSVLRLSRRMDLLEIAKKRHMCRGDALDLIAAVKRQVQANCGARRLSAVRVFATQFAAFAAVYLAVATAWCLVMAAGSY